MTPTPPSSDRPSPARVRYGPGPGTAVAGPGSVGLVQGPPDDPAVSAIVDALLSGADIHDLIDRLAVVGIRSLPGFAVAFAEGDDVRLLIRGGASAQVGHDAETTFTGAGTTSWFETVVASGPLTMRIPEATTDRATFVLVAGSAPASVIDFDPASGDAGDPTSGEPVAPRRVARFESAAPVPPVMPKRAPVADAPSSVAVNPPVPTEAPAAGFASEDIDFGHLLGATVYRTVEAAAVRPDDEGEDGAGQGGDEATDPIGVEEPPAVNPTDALLVPALDETLDPEEPPASFETRVYDAIDPPLPPAPDPASGLISAVPGMAGTRAEEGERFTPVTSPMASGEPDRGPVRLPATSTEPTGSLHAASVPPAPAPVATASAADTGDHEPDSHTISIADLRARQAAGGASSGPTVQAVHCTAMHPNPPHSDRCRTCDAHILDHSVRTISRPSLGELHFDDGQIIPLDRPVVVGRKPADDALVGGEAARAVRLSDPDSLLSRTHLEVRLVDWQVQIVDRDSMNHTFVALPGKPPTQLRPAEPFPIPPATIVRLGDAATFTYQVGS